MASAFEHVLAPREHDLGGGFAVRRLLPQAACRSVGPFVFFDEMGPVRFAPGRGVDVRPHPHIGLATVTWLFEGALMHRDSLGAVQEIRPGEVNWMTAGRGIVHSERSPEVPRRQGHALHGIQTWVALPQGREEAEPAFHHHGADGVPRVERDGVSLEVIAGEAFGLRSSVPVFVPTLYVAAGFEPGASLVLDAGHAERAVYAVDSAIEADGEVLEARHLGVLAPGREVRLHAPAGGRVVLCGGAALDGPRRIWWNFVASDPARIEQAKRDWAEGRFGAVPGDAESIPLPPA